MKKLNIFLAAALLAVAGAASAATVAVGVTGTVVPYCEVNFADSPSFGSMNPSMGGDAFGMLDFWCTKGTPYTITVNTGKNASGSQARMKHATLATYIPYNISLDYSSGVGGGRSSGQPLGYWLNVMPWDLDNAEAGSYSDTVDITITP